MDRSGICGRDDFLAMVYRRLHQIFNVDFEMEIKAFRQMFLKLFHEQDQPYIQYWLTLPENQDISQMYRSTGVSLPPPALEEEPVKVYTIVQTAVNADQGFFPDPFSWGSYSSLEQARERLAELVTAAKKDLSDRYNKEDISEDHWEAYEDGYAAACFMRIEVLVSDLLPAQRGGPCHA